MSRPNFLELLSERVIIFDGAAGSNLQEQGLTVDDFDGAEGCNEVLVRTRPDVVRELHDRFLSVGCHVVETNSFGGTSIVLAEYNLQDQALELNRRAAELAKDVASSYSTADRPRYVAGSMGPTTKLPSLGHISFDEMTAAYQQQAAGLLQGGVDILAVETCQDILQARAALLAIRRELSRLDRRVVVMVGVTVELSGTMLIGTELSAALATLLPLRPDIVGLNCATGPLEMKQHIQLLARQSPLPLSAMPNAGLPENVGGRTVYPLSPEEFARWHASFIVEDGVQVVGGCCGTTPEHLARLVEQVDNLTPRARQVQVEPSLSSLYFAAPLEQQPKPFFIGERTNANGSRAFRDLLLADDFDGMVELARDQERGGAHALDLCTAYVGRDEVQDMTEVVTRFSRQVRVPLVIDTTQIEVMETALRLCGGRCLLNSVNLENGEERAQRVLELARDFGAAVVALAIDEQGMARTIKHKLEVTGRIYRMATEQIGLSSRDLVFDMLTFTVGSGDESLKDAACQTLKAIDEVKAQFPGAWTILGVSNISFGLKPRARKVLNSVFLHMAVEQGLDLAIVDAGKILPLSRIDETTLGLAEDLLLDRQPDALMAYIDHFRTKKRYGKEKEIEQDTLTLPEQIHIRVVEGNRTDLELLLAAALTQHGPLEIINQMLIPAMKEVGELFGAGKMQLPFVLQSAEVMKQAVSFLEPMMDRAEAPNRGTLVLATVKGDVHDIGKNLVDILLSNNGYRVLNLGIKVPIEQMLETWQAEKADAIGMSGLLVKSTLVMKDNLQELQRRGHSPPVLLGGAALTRRYVEQDLREIYGPKVHYGKDAFEALELMQGVMRGDQKDPAEGQQDRSTGESAPANIQRALQGGFERAMTFDHAPEGLEACDVPTPPFWGTRTIELPLSEVLELINETTLFRGQWQYRRGKLSAEDYQQIIESEVRPVFDGLKRSIIDEELFVPRAVYGYFPCHSDGNQLVILDQPDSPRQKVRFGFPRQLKTPYHCIADFFKPQDQGPDCFGCFVVTIGPAASDRTAQLFSSHRYKDYLHLHGLAVETAEAAGEFLHRLMRQELGIHQQDSADTGGFFRQQYRGSRYSFGYPCCPNLDDQRMLFSLLDPARIDVMLTDGLQMVPEQSVSAFVVHHPSAKYFSV